MREHHSCRWSNLSLLAQIVELKMDECGWRIALVSQDIDRQRDAGVFAKGLIRFGATAQRSGASAYRRTAAEVA
jgi:hypothetical protein